MTDGTLNTIRQLPILEVAQKLGLKVTRKKALCYNGHDTNPSLSIDPKKGLYHCFGCDEGGDVISLVMNVYKIDFIHACKWLMENYTILEDSVIPRKKNLHFAKPLELFDEKRTKYEANSDIYEWLIHRLHLNKIAEDYLVNTRNFSLDILHELEVKDISNPISVFNDLKNSWSEDSLINCGLCKRDDQNKLKFIWWDHVIVFPFTNLNHRIDYLQARRLKSNEPKYVNLNNIKPSIFNISVLQKLKNGDRLLICEGIPDTISALNLGHNAIGILGANSFNSDAIDLLINYDLCIIPDSDQGGQKFISNIKRALRQRGKAVRIFRLPSIYNDLNELFVNENR